MIDAHARNILPEHARAEGEMGQNRQFLSRIGAIDIHRRIRFREPQPLRLLRPHARPRREQTESGARPDQALEAGENRMVALPANDGARAPALVARYALALESRGAKVRAFGAEATWAGLSSIGRRLR